MGDQYNNNGTVGHMGPNSGTVQVNVNSFEERKFSQRYIMAEISKLQEEIQTSHANNAELMEELAKLNQAHKQEDVHSAVSILKKCGTGIVKIATQIGCSLITSIIQGNFPAAWPQYATFIAAL